MKERGDGKCVIWVVGCPKSGNSWISKLIAEALDSPVGGPWREDRKMFERPPSTEGEERTGPYWIYTNHLREYPALSNQKIVSIVRDPRDVMVSAKYYWAMDSIPDGIEKVIYRWKDMVEFWVFGNKADTYVSYEQLKENTASHLSRMLDELGVAPSKDITHVVKSQEFHNKRARVESLGESNHLGLRLQRSMLRKGVVGDWKNHFTQKDAKRVHDELFDHMNLLGYEDDPDWWRKL